MPANKKLLLSNWHKLKLSLHIKRKPPVFHEGEIWWTHLGENVGSELNGKGDDFLRPVLIMRKFSSNNFLGVPLTSKAKTGIWYCSFRFHGKTSTASLVNTRDLSALRLKDNHPIGNINRIDLVRIRTAYRNLIFGY